MTRLAVRAVLIAAAAYLAWRYRTPLGLNPEEP